MGIRWIRKVGAAIIEDQRLLVVRKRGLGAFILPGGKPEGDETEVETLTREVDEELGCSISGASLAGTFKDVAAGASDSVVVLRLYTAKLVGVPGPRSEIEELAWVPLRGRTNLELAPSIVNGVLPHLRRLARGVSGEGGEHRLQGVFELVQ